MKLISFDVGIKNMAYCIFQITPGSPPSILDWNVLNLLEKDAPQHICNCYLKPKNKKTPAKLCGRVAKFSKGSTYFCDKHAKTNTDYFIPTKQTSPSHFNKMKVPELNTICKDLQLMGEHDHFTRPILLNKIHEYYENKSFVPIVHKKKKSANDTDLITIGKKMKSLLNKISGIHEITHVIIENQISPIANRMKTIQGMLAQYFIMNNSDIHIEFISSANKLSMKNVDVKNENKMNSENTFRENGEGDREPLENINSEFVTQNSVYKKHKIDGVTKCSQLLDTNDDFKKWKYVLETKKKDDLADCFLQGIWYIQKIGNRIA
jgi:hypothetical protein